MTYKVKSNGTEHELQEVGKLEVLGESNSTSYTKFSFPNSHKLSDYEYLILACMQPVGSTRRILDSTYIPITDVYPQRDSDSNKATPSIYWGESNIYEATAYFSESNFWLKSKNATYCFAQLFGKLLGGS